MFEKRFDEKNATSAILGAWLGFSSLACYLLFVENNTNVYAENGILETAQAVLLALACILFLSSAIWEKGEGRLVILFCSLLCYGFVLREVDVETFDIPDLLIMLGSGTGRNLSLAAGLILLCLAALFAGMREQIRLGLNFARSQSGLLLLSGCGFLLLGDVMILLSAVYSGAFLGRTATAVRQEVKA